MTKFNFSEDSKEVIQYAICVICIVGAMIMSFLALYITPEGEIHSSVLWICGQVLVFVGSIFGITSIHRINMRKIDAKIGNSKKDKIDKIDKDETV